MSRNSATLKRVSSHMEPAGKGMNANPEIKCLQLSDPYMALGLAANLLSKVEPYGHYRMDVLIPTLWAEIQRGHYVFTVQDETVVGYAGWALCDPEVARAWVEGRYTPNFQECVDGIAPVLMTFHSKSRKATLRQIRHMRSLYSGQEVFFRRDYASGLSRHANVMNIGSSEDATS